MEFYGPYINSLMEHISAHIVAYAIGAPTFIGLMYVTRRYSVGLILYSLEFCAYAFVWHTIVHLIVRLAAWFKNSSSMERILADGLPEDAVFWTTPWLLFWEWEIYNPLWLKWLDGGFLIVILLLMARYRPMKVQHVRKNKESQKPVKQPGKYADDFWGDEKRRRNSLEQTHLGKRPKKN